RGVLPAVVDSLGQLGATGPEHRRRSRVAEHLGERGAPRARAHHRRSHVGVASASETGESLGTFLTDSSRLPSCRALRRSSAPWEGAAGGVSPRMPASRAVMSFMIASVAPRRTSALSGWPVKADRSTGGPATICTVVRGNRCGRKLPYGRIRCAPHCATGITGAPVARASLATPVLATIGHRSGSRVAVASGYKTTQAPSPTPPSPPPTT